MGFLNTACLILILLDWRRSHIARGLASQEEGICEFVGRQLREKWRSFCWDYFDEGAERTDLERRLGV
jgi:hypothetical protein